MQLKSAGGSNSIMTVKMHGIQCTDGPAAGPSPGGKGKDPIFSDMGCCCTLALSLHIRRLLLVAWPGPF